MTMYQTFRNLEIDFSRLGLEPDDARGPYFCTPKGAEIIGWAGVDGIHCCFVKGFGEMVFSVNPSNPPGEQVHPLARSFEEFLRLLLACGLDAAEQAWMWNRGEFDAFRETYPPGPEQQAAYSVLRDRLGLAPMDNPYGYIREVQSGFDRGKIPFTKEYYKLLPEQPETPERPAWNVYFANGFSSRHTGHDRPGKELPVHKTFVWGGHIWRVPSVYVCGKGLVVDLCMEVDPAVLRPFLEKWQSREAEHRAFTLEEQERRDMENPMRADVTPVLTVHGSTLPRQSGNGFSWVPDSCCPASERRQDREGARLLEHYGLDPTRGWTFCRESFSWATRHKPVLRTVRLSLQQQPVSVAGPRFTVSGAGDCVNFLHPVTGEAHTLRVAEYEARQLDTGRFPEQEPWEYPAHYIAMSYMVEPELPRPSMTVRACGEGDTPRERPRKELAALRSTGGADGPVACSVGIIGGADGPTAILLAGGQSGSLRTACSPLYFEVPRQMEWRVVFFQKTAEDIQLDLPLPPT